MIILESLVPSSSSPPPQQRKISEEFVLHTKLLLSFPLCFQLRPQNSKLILWG